MSDLNELRKIAEPLRRGAWRARPNGFESHLVQGRREGLITPFIAETESEEIASYIATFDPPTVLALIARLEQAEQDRVKLRNRLDAMRRQRDGYRNQLRKARTNQGENNDCP